jgi:hypothetical protein
MLTKWHYAAMQDVYKLVGDHKDRTQDASAPWGTLQCKLEFLVKTEVKTEFSSKNSVS